MGAVGSMVGKAAGAAIGTALLPGIGTKIGGFLGGKIGGSIGNKKDGMTKDTKQNVATGIMGAGQRVVGMIQAKKAEELVPSIESKLSRDYLEEIKRKRRALETGSAGSQQTAAIRQMVKGTGINAFKAGGMANTGALAAMISQGASGITEQQGAQSNALLAEQGKQVSEMAQRAYDTQFYGSQVKKAQGETNIGAGQTNLLAAIGGGGPKSGKKKIAPAITGTVA